MALRQETEVCELRWAEWNGRYRNDVRRFWRGDEGMLGLVASRICGSADIHARSGKGPEASMAALGFRRAGLHH